MNKERKVLYVHDGPRWISGSKFLGTEDDLKLKRRYQFFGEKVDFMMRLISIPENKLKNEINISNDDIDVIGIPPFNRPQTILNYFKAKNKIISTIKGYDMLIIRLPSTIGSEALKAAIKFKIPFLTEVVACPWDALTNHSLLGKIYAPFSYLKMRKGVRKSPFVIYVTNHFLQSRYPTNGICGGISDVMINAVQEKELEKKITRYSKLSKSSEIILSTIAAVDVPYKGHKLVLYAIAFLNKKGFNFKYRIVGAGNNSNLEALIERLGIQDSVIFEGPIRHDSIFDFLDGVDIYIQPSFVEGLPRALVEAMSKGCACIGSNAGGIPELLDSNYIFKKGNVSELIKKLQELTNKKELIQQSARNFERAKSFYPENLDAQRKEIYQKFINSLSK